MEFWSIQWNKQEIIPLCGCVNTTVQMHHIDTDKV